MHSTRLKSYRVNKMRVFLFVLILSSLAGCTHRVYRADYKFGLPGQRQKEPVILKEMQPADSAVMLGRISLKDGWWVFLCDEGDAIKILKAEGHQLRADVINIINEKRPNLASSCYRCEAEFYRLPPSASMPPRDEYYDEKNLKARVKKDNRRNAWMVVGSAAAGGIVGVLLVLWLLR
jgi:hypothetical protein